jgi:hypothetical protein
MAASIAGKVRPPLRSTSTRLPEDTAAPLTVVSSHLAKHYDIEAWPMTATWNDVREEVDWSITVTVAARWREIRGL